MPNRLAAASSPYLLQHQDNPVDWYEWGDEAFAAAQAADKPVLLSIGYSACHWCHVMAHESFEDEATAAYMNEHFVNVKVDREERPDVDRVYMDAVQAISGHGGWPMTVFLDPEGRPFFAGTYFPRDDRGHHPSFRRVMASVLEAWETRRSDLEQQAAQLTNAIQRQLPAATDLPTPDVVTRAMATILAGVDDEYGGFGGAPKFPQPTTLEFLLRALVLGRVDGRETAAASAITQALDHMSRGGIYDQIAGGFARYAVDRIWLVPHFEKMLYDNALLARLYLRAWQTFGDAEQLRTATETLDYLIRDMRHPEGGFYAAEDADSEGVEGKFYVWTWDDFAEALGADVSTGAAVYGATPSGNFEGSNVLFLPQRLTATAAELEMTDEELTAAKSRIDAKLRRARDRRVRPGLDDKIITAWNGMALRAFAEAGAVLDNPTYLEVAVGIAEFVGDHVTDAHGRLLRSWREGKASVAGFCDDYAAMSVGLFTLYQATGDERWYREAARLVHEMIRLFADTDGDGFYATGEDAAPLIARPKNYMDNPTPSDNSLAAEALVMLSALSGDTSLQSYVDGILRGAGQLLARYPHAAGRLLSVYAATLEGPKEVAIVGPDDLRHDLVAVVWERFRPDCVLAFSDGGPSAVPLLADRTAGSGARAYVCRGFECLLPVDDRRALRAQLDGFATEYPA
jgi:uncharacterized protein YyaL (SSP411 family)